MRENTPTFVVYFLLHGPKARDTTAHDTLMSPDRRSRTAGPLLSSGGFMKVVTLIVAGVVAIATSGCAARVAVVSQEKSAYVVKTGLFGLTSSMFHCKADGAKPVCTQVEESE
jgi:hypothetical protein